ncbi:winged helix-turn-helix transcriptional regulator [soil metagenome]
MSSPVICVGATLVDELFFCEEKTVAATSNPAVLKRYAGGVIRNIAHQLALLEVPVQLITVLGNDADGEWLIADCARIGIGIDALLRVNDSTGKYASILDADGSLYAAACTDPCGKYLDATMLQQQKKLLLTAAMIIADTNIPAAALEWLAVFCKQYAIPLLVEPVSVAKARKLAGISIDGIFMLTPNEDELVSLCAGGHKTTADCVAELVQRGVQYVWLRKGENGSVIFHAQGTITLHVPSIKITDSTGAGDAALAGWVAARYYGMNGEVCLKAGHALALEVLQSGGAVLKNLTKEHLFHSIKKYYPDES